jgi:hypothetical protein
MPEVRIPFEAQGEGGDLAVWLFDEDAAGKVRAPYAAAVGPPVPPPPPHWEALGVPVIGHGALNLRFYDGGDTMKLLTPGTRYTAKVQLEPMDAMVPRGHRLTAWVFQYTYQTGQGGDRAASTIPSPVTVVLGGDGAVLRLPTIGFDPTRFFPVPAVAFPQRDLFDQMDILKPFYTGGGAPLPSGAPGSGGGPCGVGIALLDTCEAP